MNPIEKRLARMDLTGITPGVRVQAHLRGRKIVDVAVGRTYPYYDLASLTKILFTATYAMDHLPPEELDHPLGLEWWKRKTTPRELLTHTAGLEWWLPMYKKLSGPLEWDPLESTCRHASLSIL